MTDCMTDTLGYIQLLTIQCRCCCSVAESSDVTG